MVKPIILNTHPNSLLDDAYKEGYPPQIRFQGKVMSFVLIKIKDNNGQPTELRELQHRNDVVSVVPYNPYTETLLLGKEHRAGAELHENMDPFLLGSFAGIKEEGETDEQAALRESNEETELVFLEDALIPVTGAPVFPSPGGSSERVQCFIALTNQKFEEKTGLGEANENISSHIFHLDQAIHDIDTGDITMMFAILSIYYIQANRLSLKNHADNLYKRTT